LTAIIIGQYNKLDLYKGNILKIEKQLLDDHQVKLTVEIEADKMDEMKRRAAKKIARSIKVSGFRPGKAPYAVVLKQVGEAAVLEEAMELLVEDIYPQVLKEAEIEPYGPGKLENVQSMDPVVLEFVIPLEAEVVLGDYSSIRKTYEPVSTTEEDIDDVLKDFQERQAVIEPIEHTAEEGDLVSIKISAVQNSSEPGEEETELIAERSTRILIQKPTDGEKENEDLNQMEWPFTGFSEKLIGTSAGDELDVEYDYPEEEFFNELSGQSVIFHVVVENVKHRILPELDDEFASSLGDFENIEALREEIRNNLEAQSKQSYDESYDQEIIEEAIEQTDFKYPPQMLDSEIDQMISELGNQLKMQGLDMDLYLKTRNMDKDGLREEIKPTAEFRLKRALFLYEFAGEEKIQINNEELQVQTVQTLDYLSNTLPKNEARRLNDRQVVSNIANNIMVDMLSSTSMDRFRDIAKGLLEKSDDDQTPETSEPSVDEGLDKSIKTLDELVATEAETESNETVEPTESIEEE
jgi:trigger factor